MKLFAREFFEDIIESSISRRNHPGLSKWALNSKVSVLLGIEQECRHTHRRPCKVRAEMRMMWPQVKEHQAPPKGRKGRALYQNCKRPYNHTNASISYLSPPE